MRSMAGSRIMAATVMILGVAACSKEPDFNARFEKAEAEIAAQAKMLDEAAAKADADAGLPVRAADPASLQMRLPIAAEGARGAASSGE